MLGFVVKPSEILDPGPLEFPLTNRANVLNFNATYLN